MYSFLSIDPVLKFLRYLELHRTSIHISKSEKDIHVTLKSLKSFYLVIFENLFINCPRINK